MQYSPKLKVAMEEIKAILAKNDIAGMVLLHTPGHGEYFIKVDPTYSCAFIENEKLRIRSKLAEYGGDRKK